MISVYNLIIHGWYRSTHSVCSVYTQTNKQTNERRQTNICPIKNAFFWEIEKKWWWKRRIRVGRIGICTDWHTSSSSPLYDRTNTIIMTWWVYTVCAATIFSYSTISSLCRILFIILLLLVELLFTSICSHRVTVCKFNKPSRCNYIHCDINDVGNFRIYKLVIVKHKWLMNFCSTKKKTNFNCKLMFARAKKQIQIATWKFSKMKRDFNNSFRAKLLQIDWIVPNISPPTVFITFAMQIWS